MKFIKIFSLFTIFSLLICQNWSINIKAEINLWNLENNMAIDYENYLGVHSEALDEYDILDVPEPPTLPNNYISFYFYQPSGNETFQYYTQDIKSNDAILTTAEGKKWYSYVVSDALGETSIYIEPNEFFPNCLYSIKIDEIEYFDITEINFSINPFEPKLIEITIYDCPSLEQKKMQNPQKTDLKLSPNPFNGNSTIKYNLNRQQEVYITIYNLIGKEIIKNKKILNTKKGNNSYKINSDNLKTGIYFIELKTKEVKEIKKFTVLK